MRVEFRATVGDMSRVRQIPNRPVELVWHLAGRRGALGRARVLISRNDVDTALFQHSTLGQIHAVISNSSQTVCHLARCLQGKKKKMEHARTR